LLVVVGVVVVHLPKVMVDVVVVVHAMMVDFVVSNLVRCSKKLLSLLLVVSVVVVEVVVVVFGFVHS